MCGTKVFNNVPPVVYVALAFCTSEAVEHYKTE